MGEWIAADGSKPYRPQVLEQCGEIIYPVEPAAIVVDQRQPWRV